MQRAIELIGTMPPEIQDALERYGRGEQSGLLLILSRVFALMFWLLIGAIFSTLGGLLGAAIFRRQPPPPPGVVDIPPPPT